MSDYFAGFTSLPAHGMAAILLVIAYMVQSEVRFGAKARSHSAGESDGGSSRFLGLAAAIPVLGFALAMKVHSPVIGSLLPQVFREATMPGMPAVAWAGILVGFCGLAVRLWAVLTLRERYTRTLLIQDTHAVERGGPYGLVRHPGYLGSLLCLNGVALASGNWIVFAASIAATGAAYAYRVRVEDRMLVAAFGASYDEYRREIPALLPIRW